jgi:glucose-1-phosphate thymidylyltransferase
MLNSDNYYPVSALRALRALGGPGLAAFERDALVRESNIPPDRVKQFAVVRISPEGVLERITEKPDEATLATMGPEIWVSMNLWMFGPSIFRGCANVKPSARGELELQDAVQYSIDALGERMAVVKFHEGVLDLSTRSDIPAVAARLRNVRVEL